MRSFRDEIRRNERRTILIMALMLAVVWGVVWAAGVLLGTPPVFTGVLALVLGGGYLWYTMSHGVESVLRAAEARPANPEVRAERQLMHRVEEMALAAQIPPPAVYVQESKDPNAFAAGLKLEDAVICVTTGGLELWDQEQLEGVIAHEMAHVLNRDIRLGTVTVAVVGMVALISEIVLRSLWFSRAGGKRDVHPALIVVALVALVLAPIFTRLTYLMMSRNREYLADATAVRLTRNQEGLAGALEVLRDDLPDDPQGSRTVAALYLGNPWKRTGRASLWSTHPPLEQRIARIRSMT